MFFSCFPSAFFRWFPVKNLLTLLTWLYSKQRQVMQQTHPPAIPPSGESGPGRSESQAGLLTGY